MKRNIKKIIIVFTLCISIILVSGFGCRENKTQTNHLIQLKMWGVFDNSNEIYPFIKSYTAKHPGVQINYQKKMFSEYEDILLNGLAENTGPDIFVIHNTWLPKYKKKISPAPEDLIPINAFRDAFVSVTEEDLTENNKVYALPLYVDTLAMYYNHDHYKVTKYGKPAPTWEEFKNDIHRLNIVDPRTKIFKRSAVALGTENNVGQAVDILFQLFLQNGVNFYNTNNTRTAFTSRKGINTFLQYLSYSNPNSDNYSWQSTRPDDIYEFVNGNVSTIIGYSYLYEQIAAQSRTKGLDFRIAAMPQVVPSAPVTYADYWAYTVRNMPNEQDEQKMRHAWNFLKTLASEESAITYHDTTKRPTARRTLLESQEKDPDFGVFVNQVRYAKSIKNYDRDKYNDFFEEAIENVRTGQEKASISLGHVAQNIDKLIAAYTN